MKAYLTYFVFLLLNNLIFITLGYHDICEDNEVCINGKCCFLKERNYSMCCPFLDGECCDNELCCHKGTNMCNKEVDSLYCDVMEIPKIYNYIMRPDNPTLLEY